MKNITIIGAGLSGTLLAMNLLNRDFEEPVQIKLIDRNKKDDLGPAYSTNENYLLNVPVEIMGVFSKDPENFLKWAHKKQMAVEKGDYLPRKVYRRYVQDMLQQAQKRRKKNIMFDRIQDEVLDIIISDNRARVVLKNQDDFETDKVVFALGNSLPKNPELKDRSFLLNSRYFQNPWHPDILNNISQNDTILFIGTGQTMVDLVTGLYDRKHKGKMLAISRRGVLPMSQRKTEPYPSFFDELKDSRRIAEVFSIVRKHLRVAGDKGIDPRSVIDSLRPHTIAIWMSLPPKEKRRFLRHVFRYWEIIRSRIPPVNKKIIQDLQSSKQLKILAGRVIDFIPDKNAITMKYLEKDSMIERTELAHCVINCIGPNLDYERIDQPLIKNLLKKKLIQCDPAHLGINALPNGTIIKNDGEPSEKLYTIGLTLKGIVWEALATPEIRVQAENLSQIL